jgi:hypothetical protein
MSRSSGKPFEICLSKCSLIYASEKTHSFTIIVTNMLIIYQGIISIYSVGKNAELFPLLKQVAHQRATLGTILKVAAPGLEKRN